MFSHTHALIKAIGKWVESISTPDYREFKRKQIGYILADDFDHELGIIDPVGDYTFPPDIEKQRILVLAFLGLQESARTLRNVQFYFRRYPFSDLPVSKHDHARNICEFYFGCFYIIECRLKQVINALKVLEPSCNVYAGEFIKLYQKEFRRELRYRNTVIHKEQFDDIELQRIFIIEELGDDEQPFWSGWKRRHEINYREFCKKWSGRVHARSRDVDQFIEALSQLILQDAGFLTP